MMYVLPSGVINDSLYRSTIFAPALDSVKYWSHTVVYTALLIDFPMRMVMADCNIDHRFSA